MQKANSIDAVSHRVALMRLLGYSGIGVVFFFWSVNIGGKSTILLDHVTSYLVTQHHFLAQVVVTALILYGAFSPWRAGQWKSSLTNRILSVFKLIGLVLTLMYWLQIGPAVLFEKDMLPFLFEKLVMPVGLIVPLGAIALTFLVGFGLLEFVGVMMQPIMRSIWRTPGYSAIDAVASFVGSYSIGLLITNRMFVTGKYSVRDAAIIATGFSTVSATFLVIFARMLNLSSVWNLYFWSTLLVTFSVTAITARILPISRLASSAEKASAEAAMPFIGRCSAAYQAGLHQAGTAGKLVHLLKENFRNGLLMSSAILPSILSVGLLGILAARFTPVFDVVGWLLYPFVYLAQLPEPMAISKALATGLAEVFLPAVVLRDSDLIVRFVAGVVPVSGIIFFSALIPCILATKIPLSVPQMLLIWLIRMVLSILLAAAIAHGAIALGWLV